VGIVLGLEASMNPFSTHSDYRSIAALPLAERCTRLRDPALRERLRHGPESGRSFTATVLRSWSNLFALEPTPDYEPERSESIAARAARRGVDPADEALDVMLQRDGRGLLYAPVLNYAEGSLDAALEMMQHPDAILGLGDGGAHVGMICDASLPTFMLAHWTRDRARGERLSLPWVIRAQSAVTARAVGLLDRGILAPGYRADLNLIDYDRLTLHAPEIAHDLPAGGKRLLQRADGYVATFVRGELTYENGKPTEALPGRLVRGAKPAPAATA
jgi:N-acyl-D-aspartate/D-glutamate deacylase